MLLQHKKNQNCQQFNLGQHCVSLWVGRFGIGSRQGGSILGTLLCLGWYLCSNGPPHHGDWSHGYAPLSGQDPVNCAQQKLNWVQQTLVNMKYLAKIQNNIVRKKGWYEIATGLVLTGSLDTMTVWKINGALTSKCLSQLSTSLLVLRGQVENSRGLKTEQWKVYTHM